VKDTYHLVSVAIPVYNGANYMRDAIDSVLAQTYPDIEILVVNDGAKDGGATEEIAKSYGDRIQYFSKPNGGVASALNLALKEAKGEFFCWLSHDDIYLPEKVEKEMGKLLSLSDSNSVVFCHYSIMNYEGKYLYTPELTYQCLPNQFAYQLILAQGLHCCTILAPKSLYLESGGFREDLPTTQDYDLLVKIGLTYPFIELPEVLLKSRSHSEQGSLTLGHLKEIEQFFEEHIPLLSEGYMHKNFAWQESISAFLALGYQMSDRNFDSSLLMVAKQLINCEVERAEPEALFQALHQLSNNDYSINCEQPSIKISKLGVSYAKKLLKVLLLRILILLGGHLKQVERFVDLHIPSLLSEDYIHNNFTWQESISTFLSLGKQMRHRYFANSFLVIARQLVNCEAKRAEPQVLLQALYQLTYTNETMVKIDLHNLQSLPDYLKHRLKALARRLPPKIRYIIRSSRDWLKSNLASRQLSLQKNEQQKFASLDFEDIYKNNGFEGTESLSGGGSSLFQTRLIREKIPQLLEDLKVKHFLDVPCGDWNWMRHLDLSNVHYTGGDIVQSLIDSNNKTYGNEICKFEYLNIITGPLPKADLILCRDCLVHLSFIDGLAALEQFRNSGATWLLTTTFTERNSNIDLYEGNIWRPLNLEKAPYNLPQPEQYINEGCTEGDGLFGDKCLGLWRLN
jgi:glycosyltransferase involved in cell wall biosynthesis